MSSVFLLGDVLTCTFPTEGRGLINKVYLEGLYLSRGLINEVYLDELFLSRGMPRGVILM